MADAARNARARRGPISSAHFVFSRRPGGHAPLKPSSNSAQARTHDACQRPIDARAVPVLLMAVPKRLLKRAIDRNTLRRVAREAWRERQLASDTRDHSRPLLRLSRRPEGFESMTQLARKRLWRAEIDQLLARAPHA